MVCYHNNDNIADYGSLGHAEVIDLSIPEDSLADFTKTYLTLMDKDGNRPDMADRGTEFRSLIGIPGGVNSPLFEQLKAVIGDFLTLSEGQGNDSDTIFKK